MAGSPLEHIALQLVAAGVGRRGALASGPPREGTGTPGPGPSRGSGSGGPAVRQYHTGNREDEKNGHRELDGNAIERPALCRTPISPQSGVHGGSRVITGDWH